MSKIFVFFLWFSSFSLFASNLPAEHEAIRLMLAVETSVESNDWLKAQKQLQALESLELKYPEDFYYFNGLVYFQLKHFDIAEKHLEQYVVTASSQGKYYIQALKLITLLDAEGGEHSRPKVQEKSVSILSGGRKNGYIKSLQALYLTDDPVKALVMQVNSLLSVNVYTGSRVKKSSGRQGLAYSISVNHAQLTLQEKKYKDGFPSLSASRIDVHGLDPFLRYECEKRKLACTIYHPANAHIVWITVAYDNLVAGELVEALSKLIQQLQR